MTREEWLITLEGWSVIDDPLLKVDKDIRIDHQDISSGVRLFLYKYSAKSKFTLLCSLPMFQL